MSLSDYDGLFYQGEFDEIVFNFDGNNNDSDDIAAMVVAAMIAKAAGLEERITFFYNNNFFQPNEDWQVSGMAAAAAFAESLGITTVNYDGQVQAATDELTAMLDSGLKVLVLEGGPLTATYDALQAVHPDNYENIQLISHSVWNNGVGIHPKTEVEADFPDVDLIQLHDQNGFPNSPHSGFNSKRWDWMTKLDTYGITDPEVVAIIEEADAIMDMANAPDWNGTPGDTLGLDRDVSVDASDAGMLMWALLYSDPSLTERVRPWDVRDLVADPASQLAKVAEAPTTEAGVWHRDINRNWDVEGYDDAHINDQDTHIIHKSVDRRIVMEAEDGTHILQQNAIVRSENAEWQVTNGFDFDLVEGTQDPSKFGNLVLDPSQYSGEGIIWNTDPTLHDYELSHKNYNITHNNLVQRMGALAYSFEIDSPGNYHIGIRMIKPENPWAIDQVNDVWFGVEAGLPVWNNKAAYGENTSDFNWEKVYFNGRGSEVNPSASNASYVPDETFHWTTWGPQAGSVPWHRHRFEEPGVYTIYIGTRSQYVGIDQIQLVHQGETIDGPGDAKVARNFDFTLASTKPVENEAPKAVVDAASVNEGATVTIDVLANDSDAETDTAELTIISVSTPDHGTAEISNDGKSIIYTATQAADYTGQDGFTYVVQDADGATGSAHVVVDINAAPVANDDEGTVDAGQAVTLDVLANDWDSETAAGNLQLVSVGPAAHGTVVINPDNTVTYTSTAAPSFAGTDSFIYTLADEGGATTTATVDIDTTPTSSGRLEIGHLDLLDAAGASWLMENTVVHVAFEEEIEDAVVTMGPLSYNGPDPAYARVLEVTDSGFTFQIDEWEYLDGNHAAETISWMAASEGAHTLSDGTVIQAGTVNVTDDAPVEVLFAESFAETPLVFSQVATQNDAQAVVTRTMDVDVTGMSVQMQEEEASDGTHATEEVDWIAIENTQSIAYSAGTADFRHQWVDLGVSDVDETTVVLAEMQTLNGADTAALRYQATGSGLWMMVQEESSADGESWHRIEHVGYFTGETGVYDLS